MLNTKYPVFIKDYIYGIKEFLLPLGLAGIPVSVDIRNNQLAIQVSPLTIAFSTSDIVTKTLSEVLYKFACSYTHRRERGDSDIPRLYFERYKEEYNREMKRVYREREKTCGE